MLHGRLAYTAVMSTGNALLIAGSLGAAMACVATTLAMQDGDPLYTCVAPAAPRALEMGATICDAAPTDALALRLDVDNLQLRAGALVTEVTAASVLHTAGLQEGDVIYRVGGVDVDDTIETTARLSLVVRASDTVVNFLRRGRPYRVKIRRP